MLINPISAAIGLKAAATKRAVLRKMRDPMAVQEEFLRDLLAHQRDTVLGRELGLGELKTIDQYRDRVPIRRYGDFEPYIARIAAGEANVLNPDPVLYLNVTSGTTGRQKRIPVTKRFRHFLGKAQFASYGFGWEAFRAHARSFPAGERPRLGRGIVGQTTADFGITDGGVPYGRATSGRIQSARYLVNSVLAHPLETMGVADAPSRHYLTLLFALARPHVGFLLIGFPINMVHLCQSMEAFSELLVEDLARGSISDSINLDPALRAAVTPRLKPAPERAAFLRAVLKRDGRLTPKTAWPSLAVLITAMGGASAFYVPRLREYVGEALFFGGNYSASEGVIGLYTDFNVHHSALAIESTFFELVPEDQWDTDHPKTVLASEAEIGRSYRVVMSNYNGMPRYDLEDIVEVVGFLEKTPLIRFQRRAGGQLSSVLEKTTEHHVLTVINGLQEEFGLALQDYCITLSEQEIPPHYLVNLELAPGSHLADPQGFLRRFDEALKQINWLYGMLRKDRIPPPKLRILAQGSFFALRQRRVAIAQASADVKLPHVSEDRQFLDGATILEAFDFVD
ncbi:MAG: GH3 auxin-responsive promoter family protein [Rhodospirillaceae bacterium]